LGYLLVLLGFDAGDAYSAYAFALVEYREAALDGDSSREA